MERKIKKAHTHKKKPKQTGHQGTYLKLYEISIFQHNNKNKKATQTRSKTLQIGTK